MMTNKEVCHSTYTSNHDDSFFLVNGTERVLRKRNKQTTD